MGDLQEAVEPAQSGGPESRAQDPPFSAEIADPGCPHCGAGKRFVVKGPGFVEDADNDWAESTARAYAAALNAAFALNAKDTS